MEINQTSSSAAREGEKKEKKSSADNAMNFKWPQAHEQVQGCGCMFEWWVKIYQKQFTFYFETLKVH